VSTLQVPAPFLSRAFAQSPACKRLVFVDVVDVRNGFFSDFFGDFQLNIAKPLVWIQLNPSFLAFLRRRAIRVGPAL
jgi:hypothetical protein